jgi:hypothetical protein
LLTLFKELKEWLIEKAMKYEEEQPKIHPLDEEEFPIDAKYVQYFHKIK